MMESQEFQRGDCPVPGFHLVERLAAGSFGTVWRAAAPGSTQVAVKIIDLRNRYNLKELRALRLVRNIRHANIVPLIGFWIRCEDGLVADGDEFFLDTERTSTESMLNSARCPSRPQQLVAAMGLGDMSLADRLHACQSEGAKGIPCDELLSYMSDVSRALDYLNQKRHVIDNNDDPVAIQHCDVKPQNILLVGGSAQLCDLGLARVLDDLRATRVGFSAAYAAPECIAGKSPSAATDQYSLAVSYVELRTGRLPFYHVDSAHNVMAAHLNGELDLSDLSEAEQAVIRKATARNPCDRYRATQTMVAELAQACANTGRRELSRSPLPNGSPNSSDSRTSDSGTRQERPVHIPSYAARSAGRRYNSSMRPVLNGLLAATLIGALVGALVMHWQSGEPTTLFTSRAQPIEPMLTNPTALASDRPLPAAVSMARVKPSKVATEYGHSMEYHRTIRAWPSQLATVLNRHRVEANFMTRPASMKRERVRAPARLAASAVGGWSQQELLARARRFDLVREAGLALAREGEYEASIQAFTEYLENTPEIDASRDSLATTFSIPRGGLHKT